MKSDPSVAEKPEAVGGNWRMPALSRDGATILAYLDGPGGLLTRDIARRIQISSNNRTNSALVRQILLSLESLGLIAPMDSERPVVWRTTTNDERAAGDRYAEREASPRSEQIK